MNTEISRYLVDANGNSFSSDTDLQSLSKNAKVKNTNSGVSYKKVQGTTSGVPVFDKVPFQEGQADAVLYSPQSLTTAQKQQARENIGVDELDGVPLGTIVMWSGKANTIPDGWVVCDGNNGTPNLVGRFVIGGGPAYPLNTYGGSTDHFHYFGYHSGDNGGNFYINGDIHSRWGTSNCPKTMKAPSKAAIISSLEYKDSNPEYTESEIKAKSAGWNGDGGGGISGQSFARGNLITTLGYGVSADDALNDCLPPYWSLYYIMKVRGTGSTSNGGTAASASQVERLSDLISQLQTRITALESSSGSGGSSSSNTQTWGLTKFNTVNGGIGESTKSVGQTVSEGKIVKIYALTHWSQTNESHWEGINHTDWYYIWKDDNYTLTSADKLQINGLPSQSDYGSIPSEAPHVTLSYNSGNI